MTVEAALFLLIGILVGGIVMAVTWAVAAMVQRSGETRLERERRVVMQDLGKLVAEIDRLSGEIDRSGGMTAGLRTSIGAALDKLNEELEMNVPLLSAYCVKYIESVIRHKRALAYTGEHVRAPGAPQLPLATEVAIEELDLEAPPARMSEQKAREEQQRETREEVERRAREEQERKARQEAEQRAREEQQRKVREEAERKAREEQERKARQEVEQRAREEQQRKAREETERKAREEQERRARQEAEQRAREEQQRKVREEAERKAREEQERKARQEAEQRAREEQQRKVREEAERKAREEQNRKARQEAEQRAREEQQREAREGAERQAREADTQRAPSMESAFGLETAETISISRSELLKTVPKDQQSPVKEEKNEDDGSIISGDDVVKKLDSFFDFDK